MSGFTKNIFVYLLIPIFEMNKVGAMNIVKIFIFLIRSSAYKVKRHNEKQRYEIIYAG